MDRFIRDCFAVEARDKYVQLLKAQQNEKRLIRKEVYRLFGISCISGVALSIAFGGFFAPQGEALRMKMRKHDPAFRWRTNFGMALAVGGILLLFYLGESRYRPTNPYKEGLIPQSVLLNK